MKLLPVALKSLTSRQGALSDRPPVAALIERLDESSAELLAAARRAPKIVANGQIVEVVGILRQSHIELERAKRRVS